MTNYQLTREERLREVVENYRPFLQYVATVRSNGLDCPNPKENPESSRVFKTSLLRKI